MAYIEIDLNLLIGGLPFEKGTHFRDFLGILLVQLRAMIGLLKVLPRHSWDANREAMKESTVSLSELS